MYFPYGLWKDAEREARRSGPCSKSDIRFGKIFAMIVCIPVAISFFSTGNIIGVFLGLAVITGMLQGLASD